MGESTKWVSIFIWGVSLYISCQISGLQDRVPRQQVLRTRDEGMQIEN